MADLRCKGCKVLFDNQKAKNQHISASTDCLNLYDNLSTHQAVLLPPPVDPPRPAHLQPAPDSPLHWPAINYDQPSSSPIESTEENIPKRRRVTIEEVEDESDENSWTHEQYPEEVATSLGAGMTVFSDILEEQKSMQEGPYTPFRDRKEWGLVKWLMRRTNQTGADEYLKLEIVSTTS